MLRDPKWKLPGLQCFSMSHAFTVVLTFVSSCVRPAAVLLTQAMHGDSRCFKVLGRAVGVGSHVCR